MSGYISSFYMEVSDYTFSIPQEILDNQDLGHEFTMTDEAMQVLAKFIVDHPEHDNQWPLF